MESGVKQLQAMKDQRIFVDHVDVDEGILVFENGLVLPIEYCTDANDVVVDDPVDGGWIHFGDDEHGYGRYPVKLVTEEEFEQERARSRARAAFKASTGETRPN